MHLTIAWSKPFNLHRLKIPRSTSLHSWHLNPAHKCLHCCCQFQAGKKVRRSWHGHDTNMTESECNWIQRHQSGQHQAPCCHTHTVTVAAVTIFAPQVPAQSKSTRTGNTDALSNHGMLAWCTWPLLGPILSPLSKNSTINIPAFLAPKSCSQVFALLLSIPSWKKGQKVMIWSWVMTQTWLNPNETEYSDIKVDNIKDVVSFHLG